MADAAGIVSVPAEASCGRNLDDIIESLGASETSAMDAPPPDKQIGGAASEEDAAAEGEKLKELTPEEDDHDDDDVPAEEEEDRGQDKEEEAEDCELVPAPEERSEAVGYVEPVSGLRRRNRPE